MHDSTTPSHTPLANEPIKLEYVVRDDKYDEKGKVIRTESAENVVVIGIMFVLKEFLGENADYPVVTNLMLDGKEEQEFRRKHGLA